MANLDRNAQVRIRDLICRDEPVALGSWDRVVDDVVPSAEDAMRIKNLLGNHKYGEAVLQTLQRCNVDLVPILRKHGLNSAADRIRKAEAWSARAQEAEADRTAAMWREVGQLIRNFSGRQVVIETLHKLLGDPENRAAGTASVVTISGLGGVGKSTLARGYAYTHRRFYEGNVLWINAETVDSMRASFIRLAKALGLQLGDQPPIALLVKKVFSHFQNKKCLVIFDNVENLADLKQFLPEIRNPDHEMPYVLVTSRRRDLNALAANEIRLDVLSPKEAVVFIQTQLPKATSENAAKLADKLQRLPLALQQAVAYIRDTYFDDDEAIVGYLKEFKKSEAKLLNDERFRDHNDYSSTTLATWQITLTRIGEMDGSGLAIRVIRALAYLNPDLISLKFLKIIFEEAETRRGLKLLERFSMISVNDGKVSIHRLVQQVVRLSFGERAEDEKQRLVMGVGRQFVKDGYKLNDINRECTSHGLHLFPFQMTDRHSAAMATNFRYFAGLCSYLMEYGNYAKALSISQQMASLYESVHGENHESTIGMKVIMAEANSFLEKFDSVPLQNSLLPTAKSPLRTEHCLTRGIQASLSADLGVTGDNEQALRIYDEILPVAERIVGENSDNVLFYKGEEASTLRRLGKLDESLELLQHVHENRVSLHGENDVWTLRTKFQIAAVHYDKKEVSRALEMWEEVEAGWRLALGDTHPDTAIVRSNIVVCKEKLAKPERSNWNCQML